MSYTPTPIVSHPGESFLPCGCDAGAAGDQRWIVFCPLHAAAPDLLAAGADVVYLGDDFGDGDFPDGWWDAFERLRTAVAKAKP